VEAADEGTRPCRAAGQRARACCAQKARTAALPRSHSSLFTMSCLLVRARYKICETSPVAHRLHEAVRQLWEVGEKGGRQASALLLLPFLSPSLPPSSVYIKSGSDVARRHARDVVAYSAFFTLRLVFIARQAHIRALPPGQRLFRIASLAYVRQAKAAYATKACLVWSRMPAPPAMKQLDVVPVARPPRRRLCRGVVAAGGGCRLSAVDPSPLGMLQHRHLMA